MRGTSVCLRSCEYSKVGVKNNYVYTVLYAKGFQVSNEEQEEFESSEGGIGEIAVPNARAFFFHPLSLFISGAVLIVLFWCAKADFFDTPPDVLQARESYFVAKQQFFLEHPSWSTEWMSIKRKVQQSFEKDKSQGPDFLVDSITPQLLLAFLTDEVGVDEARLNTLSVMPKQCGSTFTVMISKPEPTVWPFTAMLTLELECQITPTSVTLVCTRLRRGSQELSPKLTGAYFGSDLELLNRFHSISIITR